MIDSGVVSEPIRSIERCYNDGILKYIEGLFSESNRLRKLPSPKSR
jgi:hypothetical protein